MFKTSMVSGMADVKLALNLYTILCEIVYLFNTTASVIVSVLQFVLYF
jgi:hypothetical protein